MILRLPRDISASILHMALDFRPALRAVCREWARFLAPSRSPLSASELAADDHLDLLVWTHAITPFRVDGVKIDVAAALGHERIVRRCIEWGVSATNVEHAMFHAARNGHESIVRLCKDRGAHAFDVAMFHAAAGGHAAITRLCKEWGATDCNSSMVSAAGAGHADIVRLCVDWGADAFLRAMYAASEGGHYAISSFCMEQL